MNKKNIIIVASVCIVCVLAYVGSRLINWPVDYDNADGNIAKSSKFSRKTADGSASNMQELLMNDEEYRDGMVLAYAVMNTRAQQFAALVDMSVEAAGQLKEYESLIKDMKEAKPMVLNVCSSMESAVDDLDEALGGGTPEELAQNTNNAVLAYSTLQKQNSLADRFIETTDQLVKKNAASDQLKFVRDQWVDYQKMTAALDKNADNSEALDKLGYQLSSEASLQVLSGYEKPLQDVVANAETLNHQLGVGGQLSPQQTGQVHIKLSSYDHMANAYDKLANAHEQVANAHENIANAHDKIANAHDKVANAHDKVANAHDKIANAHDKVANAHDKIANAHDKVANAHDKIANAHENMANALEKLVSQRANVANQNINILQQSATENIANMMDKVNNASNKLNQ